MDSLKINEIYTSIQGESSYSGLPCTFVRLSGCSLRCSWCDTVYSYFKGEDLTFDEILEKIPSYPNLVEITGGEPLEQKGVLELMNRLVNKGHKVLIETSGSEDISTIHQSVTIIMDIKCPDSRMEDRNLYSNISHLKESDEVKFVIASEKDFDFAVDIMNKYELTEKCHVLMSCAFGSLKEEELVSWILKAKLNVRFNLQQHKYIWSPRKKGV